MMKRRRNESPEKEALRKMVNGYLKENPVKNETDINALMRETMSVILEGSLDGEIELGYSKYDFRNKETDNGRNGYSTKTLHHYIPAMDTWNWMFLVIIQAWARTTEKWSCP
jgi:hypothetical protein